MHVPVLHPVVVRHVPKGSRKARDSLVGQVCTVELATVGAGAMEPFPVAAGADGVLDLRVGDGLALHGGDLWIRLCEGRTPLAPERFRGYLAGQGGDDGAFAALNASLQRTPLVGHSVLEAGSIRGQIDRHQRGGAFDEGAQREIQVDGRGGGGIRVSDFLQSEFRIAPDAVYARFRPAVRPLPWDRTLRVFHNPVLAVGTDVPVNPWRALADRAPWGAAVTGQGPLRDLLGALPAGEGADGIGDLLRLANWLAVKARPYVTATPPSYLRSRTRPGAAEALAEAAARLVPYEARGAVGAIEPDEAGLVLQRAREAWLAFAATLIPSARDTLGEGPRIARHVDAVALPRLSAHLDRALSGDAEAFNFL